MVRHARVAVLKGPPRAAVRPVPRQSRRPGASSCLRPPSRRCRAPPSAAPAPAATPPGRTAPRPRARRGPRLVASARPTARAATSAAMPRAPGAGGSWGALGWPGLNAVDHHSGRVALRLGGELLGPGRHRQRRAVRIRANRHRQVVVANGVGWQQQPVGLGDKIAGPDGERAFVGTADLAGLLDQRPTLTVEQAERRVVDAGRPAGARSSAASSRACRRRGCRPISNSGAPPSLRKVRSSRSGPNSVPAALFPAAAARCRGGRTRCR